MRIDEIHKSASHQKMWNILKKCYIDTEQIKLFLATLSSKDEIQK